MQTNMGSSVNAVAVSYIYAVRYGYSDAVIHNDNQLRIFPRVGEGQFEPTAEIWSVPSGRGVDYNDRFGNRVRRLRVIEPHSTFVVAAAGRVRLSNEAPSAVDVPIADLQSLPESFEYASISPLVDPDSLTDLAHEVGAGDQFLVSAVTSITEWVFGNILYRRGTTSVATTAREVLSAGEGVCQDKTHLALGLLRALKIPCRYASGLLTGQRGETHSWVEFYHPVAGWLGADPTRGILFPPARDYVKFSVGRDYTDVSPVSGSFLSTGGAQDVAAIAEVRFEDTTFSLGDALDLLEGAYVVQSEVSTLSPPTERPERH